MMMMMMMIGSSNIHIAATLLYLTQSIFLWKLVSFKFFFCHISGTKLGFWMFGGALTTLSRMEPWRFGSQTLFELRCVTFTKVPTSTIDGSYTHASQNLHRWQFSFARAADRYFVFRSRFPRVPQQPDGRQWVMQFEEQCACFPSAEAWLLPPRAP